MMSQAPSSPEDVKNLARQARRGEAAKVAPLNHLDARNLEQDLSLKRKYADWLLWMMVGQLTIADLGFGIYGFANDWDIEPSVIQVWLGATVVEVIGIVLVVTRYLFPRRDLSRRDVNRATPRSP
jgi:hypothetical protein